ncbi:MAG TPA: MFS transporter [Acetobacteraceae bacterium]|nr:MFS transporter [Acetobacteraceae bacterium]
MADRLEDKPRRPGWRLLGLITALGFASGLPLALSGFTLRMWLASAHIGLGIIGLTANLGIAYALKFLWAPLFDEVAPPLHFARLGRRRGWLMVAQILLIGAIGALALCDPLRDIGLMLAAGGVLAFVSASQDILIDAWRIESFPADQQGKALAGYVWGYRAALLISGAGVIALSARTGWHVAFGLMVVLACVGPIATMLAGEPQVSIQHPNGGFAARLRDAVMLPLGEFFSRRGAVLILAFIVLFRLAEAMAGVMLAPYYTHLGFNRVAIALANGPFSLAATLAGVALGGALVSRIGVGRALLATGFFQTVSLLMYPLLGLYPHLPHILIATSMLESFAEGFSDAAFLSYLSILCNREYTATQYALLSSLAAVALRTVGGLSGYLAAAMGYVPFFVMTSFAALPAMLVLIVILRRYPLVPFKPSGPAGA